MWILVLGVPAGIIFGVSFSTEKAGYSQLLLLGLACIGLGFARTKMQEAGRSAISLLLLVFVVACGWHWGALATRDLSPWPLSETVFLTGEVYDVPANRYYGEQVKLRLHCAGTQPGQCDRFQKQWWQLPWRSTPSVEILLPRGVVLVPGAQVRLLARVRPLRVQANPGAFDAYRWMKSNHLVARVSLVKGTTIETLGQSWISMDRFRVRLNRYLSELNQKTPRPELSGYAVLLALVTGDRSLMTNLHWDVFNRTGTSHLVAISGLHIGLVAAFATWITLPLFRRWHRFTSRYPAGHGALVVAYLLALIYAAIAGFALPTQRAIIMLTVFIALKLLGRVQQQWVGLSLAFAIVLIWDPVACLSLGFWLSFIAVFFIVWILAGRAVVASKTRNWLSVQFGLMFGLAPVLLWQVHSTSLVSILTNLIAVPLVGFLIVPMSLFWALAWALLGWSVELLLECTLSLISVLIWFLEGAASWDFSVWAVGQPHWSSMLLAMIGVLWICCKGVPGRLWGGLLLLPVLITPVPGYGLYILEADNLQLAIKLPGRILFISQNHRPQVFPQWHKNLLQHWGVPIPATVVPVQGGVALWQAQGLVVTEYSLKANGLGRKGIEQIRYVDLCAQRRSIDYGAVLLTSQTIPNGAAACALQWSLGALKGLYWPTDNRSMQLHLLNNWSERELGDTKANLLVLFGEAGHTLEPNMRSLLQPDSQLVMGGETETHSRLIQQWGGRRIHVLDQNGYYYYPLASVDEMAKIAN